MGTIRQHATVLQLLERRHELELNYFCDQTGVGLMPYSPLNGGLLARPIAWFAKGATPIVDISKMSRFDGF